MKTAKIAAAVFAAGLILLLVLFLGGLFQRLLIAGARLAQDMGDTVILTEEDEIGGEAFQAPEAAAIATWPPGDDPSWSEDTPLVPVDMTAEELAEEMKNQDRGGETP